MRIAAILSVAGLTVLAAPADLSAAERKPDKLPVVVDRLLQCRGHSAAEQRLACFDQEATTIANAIARRDLVVVDSGQLVSARRTLFGLTLPRIDILGDGIGDEVKQIESTIRAVGLNREGSALFTLADGSRWSQTDSTVFDITPRPGEKVTIRRAALGSFILILAGQAPVKVKRTL